ncbi:MAG TPA: aminopeptidase P family protein [Bacteroidales bacterium]|nr:MAG: Xaa-Pro aminopeptidase [Bacteroidetes bacterium ADurb.Bin037]HPV88034.1 aminopeptidase P family protein [Bacteroidales bacterium]HPW79079.1 aminopeptidase P family protein [Bacteroidales bacterium]HQB56712.1 aminopeptidase P family protein [Bacteroidales bacterium]
MFSKEIYTQRRQALKSKLNKGIGLFMGNHEAPCNYPANTYHFRQDSTFLYFFGLDEPDLAAIIDFETGKEVLFGDDVGIDDIVWTGPLPSVKEKAQRIGISHTNPRGALATYISGEKKKGRNIHFLPPYRSDNMIELMDMLEIHPNEQKGKASEELIRAIVAMRMIKQPEEIEQIDKACDLGYAMHYTAMKLAKPGMVEQELAGIMEGIAVSGGYMPSFPIILTQNGEVMHGHSHHQVLKEGRLLLIDAGAELQSHYCSDFTRTIPVGGTFRGISKDLYELVLKANNHCIGMCAPGISFKDVHLTAARIITEGLKDIGLMKGDTAEAVAAGAHAAFFPTGLGHNMGLDVHDMEDLGEQYVGYDDTVTRSTQFGLKSLRMARVLQPGNVMTVEPGFYVIPALLEMWKDKGHNAAFINFDKCSSLYDFGGIRIEDDVLITPYGHRLLGSKRLPVTPEEIREVMQ